MGDFLRKQADGRTAWSRISGANVARFCWFVELGYGSESDGGGGGEGIYSDDAGDGEPSTRKGEGEAGGAVLFLAMDGITISSLPFADSGDRS